MVTPTAGWTLWAGTVGFDGPLAPRLAAAAENGYARVSLSPVDVQRAEETGIGRTELRLMADDAGIEWVIDPLVGWLPASAASRSPLARFTVDEVVQMAADLGAVSVSAVVLTSQPHPIEQLVDAFGRLCDAAAAAGTDVHLEFIPMTVIRDITTAWEVVRRADRENGGLLVDTWHFFRGVPDFEVLSGVPGDRIFAVQVNDAAAEPSGPLWEDTFLRLLPGEGAFDLPRIMRTLEEIGGLTWVGPEIFSEALLALGPSEAARTAREAIEAIG